MPERTVEFLRKKDLRFIDELGRGACGKTVLLHDNFIDEYFVCKKFMPTDEGQKNQLFQNFLREIKILHKLHHKNIVRIFHYYIYPEHCAGYILMEHVRGVDIENFLKQHPDMAADIFYQVVQGFSYLENHNILHRDIRPTNIIVSSNDTAKIIDF